MVNAGRQELLEELRARISATEMGNRPSDPLRSLPFGVPDIDASLPGGGLMYGAVHEVFGDAHLSQGAAAAIFIGGILARTTGPVFWALRRRDLFAPGLAGVGL